MESWSPRIWDGLGWTDMEVTGERKARMAWEVRVGAPVEEEEEEEEAFWVGKAP